MSFVDQNDSINNTYLPVECPTKEEQCANNGMIILLAVIGSCLTFALFLHSNLMYRRKNQRVVEELYLVSERSMDLRASNEYLFEENRRQKSLAIEELKVMDEALRAVSSTRVNELEKVMIGSSEIKMLQMLGKGAYGEVHLAEFRGNKIALKRLKLIDMENVEMFRFECFVMKDLRHPNIVKLIGVCW